MKRILVADKIAEAGLERMRETDGVTFDVRQGLSSEELAGIVGDYDGMLIRSAVKITAEVLANPGKLLAIARAGVGVDNIDLNAATAAGVLVLNTPDANTISTAEHTLALMLALHRRIPDAHRHVRDGKWQRSEFKGGQLSGRTLGIVGFGRIGRAVAARALAFEMTVVAFDPFVAGETALDGAVKMARDLNDLLAQSDCVTLHTTLSDETRHLIGADSIAAMKPGAKLVNCARGALVDETALADALDRGHLSGAAIDVYEHEPPTDSPLLSAKNVVLTPHLAASTEEAQTQVAIDAVDALLAYVLTGDVRSAVNVTGLPKSLSPRARAYIDLATRLGTVLSTWCPEGVDRIVVKTYGDSLHDIGRTLAWQAMAAVVGPRLSCRLNLVNAREQAEKRGIEVDHVAHSLRPGHVESIIVSVESHGKSHKAEGAVFADNRPRMLAINGYRMEIVPERSIVLIFNDDKPGVIGLVGQRFGDAGINIADMALSSRGNTALMLLKLDQPMPDEMRATLRAASEHILSVHSVTLAPVPKPRIDA